MDSIKKITVVDAGESRPNGADRRDETTFAQLKPIAPILRSTVMSRESMTSCTVIPVPDHTFFVVEGECTMKGLKDDEEFKLTKHQAVHVPAGFSTS